MKNFVKFVWCLAVIFVFSIGQSAAQNPDAVQGIKVTLNAVTPTLDENGKFTGVKAENFLRSVFLSAGANDLAAAKVLAKSFKQSFKTGEYFRLTIENSSLGDIFVYVNNVSPDESCVSAIPTEKFEKVASQKIPAASSIQSGIFRASGIEGEETFAVLAARSSFEIEKIFKASEFLTGVSRANTAPPPAVGKVLESADDLELKQSVPRAQSIDSGKIAITLGNVYSRSGKPLMAASLYDGLLQIGKCFSKLSLNRKEELQNLIISWHNNRALANYLTGDLAKSKTDYETSLALLKELRQQDSKKYLFEEAIILSNLAQVYATLGDQTEAIKRYEAALQILSATGNPEDAETQNRKAAVYNGLGTSYEFLKQFAKAESFYNPALEIQRKFGQKASVGITLNSLARLAMAQNNFAKAENLFKESLALSLETQNQSGIASACNNLGLLYARQNKFADARILFVRAATILRGLRNRTALPNILSNLMYIEQKQNHSSAAILFGKQAVEVLQEVRSEISGIEKDLQKSFVASREDIYRSLADILISEGRFSEAQSVLALLKDEEYFAYVRRDAGEIKNLSGKTDLITPADQKIIERYNLIADRVTEIGAQFQTLDDKKRKSTLLPEEQKRYGELSAQLADANAAFTLFLEKELAAEVGKSGKENIENDRALQGKLRNWGAGTVTLYTIMGRDRYRVVLTTAKTQTDGKTEISAAELNKKIFAFRAALENPCACIDPRPLGKELYDILIKPVEKDLEAAGAKILVWSLDGTLRYIPLAALSPDGKTYLVEKYQMATITSNTRQSLESETKPDWRTLGFGVSSEETIADPSAENKKLKFPALPGVPRELEAVVRDEQTTTAAGATVGKKFVDADFNQKNFSEYLTKENDDGKRQFTVVHVASHFHLGGTNENSFLLLGEGKILTLAQISNSPEINFEGVELVTLSACNTAFGNDKTGEEVDSLATFIMLRGAKSVMATLWSVADDSTWQLMSEFYRLHKANPEMSKSELIRQSQLDLLKGSSRTSRPDLAGETKETSSDLKPPARKPRVRSELAGNSGNTDLPKFAYDETKPFAHPFYWSPFVLIGNWR